MASTSKCPFCGSIVKSNEKKCPGCGADNDMYVPEKSKVVLTPHTIEELKQYCAERGMPLQRMRFFIGEDYKKPKAFGIYKKSNGDVVVYKNKADGSRAIRYEGPDEAHGVKELYMKLLEECHNRNIWPDTPDGKPPKAVAKAKAASGLEVLKGILIFVGICIATGVAFVGGAIASNIPPAWGAICGLFSGIAIGLHTGAVTVLLSWESDDLKKQTTGEQISAEESKKKNLKLFLAPLILCAMVFMAYGILTYHTPLHVAVWATYVIGIVSIIIAFVLAAIIQGVVEAKTAKTKEEINKLHFRISAIFLVLSIVVNIGVSSYIGCHPNGYYIQDGTTYYKLGSHTYEYCGSWIESYDDLDIDDYVGSSYNKVDEDDWDVSYYSRFESTSTYQDYQDSHSSSDGGSYDSWDSGTTDWDSDW